MKEVSMEKYLRISKMEGVVTLFKQKLKSVWNKDHFVIHSNLEVALLYQGFVYFNQERSGFSTSGWSIQRVIVREEATTNNTKDYCCLEDIVAKGGLENFNKTKPLCVVEQR